MRDFCFLTMAFLCFVGIYSQEKFDVFDVARNGTLAEALKIIKTNPNAFNVVNNEGYSPLILACYRGNNEVAKFMIANGCDINGTSSMGSPLMASVVKRNLEMVKLLLEKKANVNTTDANGTTALIYATMFKNYDVVRWLVKANADPNLKDNSGNSSLDYAILADDDQLIEILKSK